MFSGRVGSAEGERGLRRRVGNAWAVAGVWGMQLAAACLAALPLPAVMALGRAVADLSFALGTRRRVLLANLDLVYGEPMTAREKRRIARSAHRNLCLSVLEMLRSTHPRGALQMAEQLEFEPRQLAESVDADRRGALVAIAHSGNIDAIGVAWAQRYQKPASAAMKPLESPRINDFLVHSRERHGFGVISVKGLSALRRCVRLVRGGQVVCILPDQYARRRGVVVQFMGQPASTHQGAAVVALHGGDDCRILVAVDTRVDDGPRHVCHLVEIEDFAPSGDFERDVVALTQRMSDAMGELIAKHPESYLWHHRRWGDPRSGVRRLGKGGVRRD
jgi:Kdo2-lipid IVA lauroyltransferase/acyltransferase